MQHALLARELAPNSASAIGIHATLLQGEGKQEQALEELREGIVKLPLSRELRLQYARTLALTDLVASQFMFEEMLNINPKDEDAIYALAIIAAKNSQPDIAAKHFNSLAESARFSDEANFKLGLIKLQQNQTEEAKTYLLRVTPSSSFEKALTLLAEIYISESALADWQTLISVHKTQYPQLFNPLSGIEFSVLSSHGLHSDALHAVTQALKAAPNDLNLTYLQALGYEVNGQVAKAEQGL